MNRAVDLLLVGIKTFGLLGLAIIGGIDNLAGYLMSDLGIGPQVQLYILLAVAIFIQAVVIRYMGLLASSIMLILLALLVLHRLLQMGVLNMSAGW